MVGEESELSTINAMSEDKIPREDKYWQSMTCGQLCGKGISMPIPCLTIFLLLQNFAFVARAQSGFVSIDCGKPNDYSFKDARGISYKSDASYIDSGENHEINPSVDNPTLDQKLRDLRSFPEGKRNCYSLPATKGSNYLVRGYFLYGNYDGRDEPPSFELYMGTNLWTKVSFPNASSVLVHEIIAISPGNSIFVCVLETGLGKPFISALELRPFSNYYDYIVNSTQSMLTVGMVNFGALSEMRYPMDMFDRIWTPFLPPGSQSLSTSSAMISDDSYGVPTQVMQTAAQPPNGSSSMTFTWPVLDRSTEIHDYFIYKHFAELRSLAASDRTNFSFSENGIERITGESPKYLSVNTWSSTGPRQYSKLEFSVYSVVGSTLPPLINAMQIFQFIYLTQGSTDRFQVEALEGIKTSNKVEKNWAGDPCAPQEAPWDGVGCSYNVTPYRIISLNLSNSGLVGTISSSFSSLTQLQSLDLSSNNLSGSIPDFFASLSDLKLLNLSCNILNESSIPKALQDRVINKLLTLVTAPCPEQPDSTAGETDTKKTNTKTIVLASVFGFLGLVVVSIVVIFWKKIVVLLLFICGKREEKTANKITTLRPSESEFRAFTHSELTRMTNGFQKLLGRGATSSVYHGHKQDGTPVAVKKLSGSSTPSVRHFRDEVKTLKSINHKNLINLLGYCEERDNLALVYEYMPKGSLADLLSDRNEEKVTSSWHFRLERAYEAAQGLAYLHHDCRKPIIHRDIKPSNILLAIDYRAVIADFGTSKSLVAAGESGEPSTRIVGTPGYVDPEYIQIGEPTTKSDVYSFGVILLELITGRPAYNRFTGSLLVEWVNDSRDTGDLNIIVDQKIKEYNPESMWAVMELALKCTRATSPERPTMRNVVDQLKDCLSLPKGTAEGSSDYTGEGRPDASSTAFSSIVVESPDPR